MAKNIKSVFDETCKNVKADMTLSKRIHKYAASFRNKNADHVEFFGGNLLGVHPVRFKTSDKFEWFDDVLSIDDELVKSQIIQLPTIDPEWVRGTDTMNLSCVWLTHKFFNSTLNQKEKEKAMLDCLMVFHYKLITSLMAHNFKYQADPDVALAVYSALSKKYALKQYGSWQAMLEARCKDIIAKDSIHYKTIKDFNDDGEIQYMITDVQGRLRAIVKKLWAVFAEVRAQDAKILTTSGKIEIDGAMVVRDMSRNFTPYKRYIHEVVNDHSRFIKPELVEVIGNAMHTMPEKLLGDALKYLVEHYHNDKNVIPYLDEVLEHAFDFLHAEQTAFMRNSDIATLVSKLRAVYMSSRSTDPSLLRMRELSEQIVKKAVKSKNTTVIASVRTGLSLYVVLRTFAMQHYK